MATQKSIVENLRNSLTNIKKLLHKVDELERNLENVSLDKNYENEIFQTKQLIDDIYEKSCETRETFYASCNIHREKTDITKTLVQTNSSEYEDAVENSETIDQNDIPGLITDDDDDDDVEVNNDSHNLSNSSLNIEKDSTDFSKNSPTETSIEKESNNLNTNEDVSFKKSCTELSSKNVDKSNSEKKLVKAPKSISTNKNKESSFNQDNCHSKDNEQKKNSDNSTESNIANASNGNKDIVVSEEIVMTRGNNLQVNKSFNTETESAQVNDEIDKQHSGMFHFALRVLIFLLR